MNQVLAISGGVGGAKLALGLSLELSPQQLTICANTGDDFDHLGLRICPDLDTVMYTLAGLSNTELGWGLAGETWQFMESLRQLDAPNWFQLGDKDLATHVVRSNRLGQGATLGTVTQELCEHLGVVHPIVPMSNDSIATILHTEEGELPFQDYFVRRQCEPRVTAYHFAGAEQAQLHPQLAGLLAGELLDAVVVCPSNPFLSVAPVLALNGMKAALQASAAPVIAVSPIVGGKALKGPAAKMMQELDMPASALEVARVYREWVDIFVIDDCDQDQASLIEAMGMRCVVMATVMRTLQDKTRLARQILDLV